MNEELKELIYDLMNGNLDLEQITVKESEFVANEYDEEKFCSKAYEEVFNANCRVCERLGVDEDKDVDLIINNLLAICEHLSKKMFDYGVLFSSPSIKKE